MDSSGKQIIRKDKPSISTLKDLSWWERLGDSENAFKQFVYHFYKKNLSLYARSLAFTSVLSFVPGLVAFFSALNWVLGYDRYEEFQLNVLKIITPATDIETLQSTVDLVNTAQNVYLSAVGFLIVIWAMYNVFKTLECIFAKIWDLDERATGTWKRVPLYVLGFILLPFPIILFVELSSVVLSMQFMERLFAHIPYIRSYALPVASLLMIIAFFFLMFRFIMPQRENTGFLMNDILGAVFAGVTYNIVKYIFIWYTSNVIHLDKIYGALVAVVLFMFWAYISWMIILMGLLVSYVTKNWLASHHFRFRFRNKIRG